MTDTRRFLSARPLHADSPDSLHWHACPRIDRSPDPVDGNTTLCGKYASPRTWIYSARYAVTCPECLERMSRDL